MFKFSTTALDEEVDYPLAYGVVVHRNFIQVLFMLSAFYKPQNEYCLAVSGSAEKMFRYFMEELDKCFNNIHVLFRPPISWGSFEIVNSTWSCVDYLLHTQTKWIYYQQLSGVDVPLKTNYEMVKILRQWNNTVNSEFSIFQEQRLNGKAIEDSPLPLFKSSLSAAVPRTTLEWISKTETISKLLDFLNGTYIPDETFWTTLTGNFRRYAVPGGIDAIEWQAFTNKYRANHTGEVAEYVSNLHMSAAMNYYLARYQVWYENCGGKLVSGSCVFGVDDLANLLRQPHLIAHKFYLEFQPAAFFCVLKELRARESSPLDLNLTLYAEIPQVELSAGVPYEQLKHPIWMFS